MHGMYRKIITFDSLLKQSKYPVPIKDILKELACSRSAFYRLRDFFLYTLRAPLEYNKKYKGYIYTADEKDTFEIPGLWFTVEELEALACFEYIITSINSNILDSTLKPFRKRLDTLLDAQKIMKKNWQQRIKILPIGSRPINGDILRKLAEAVLHTKKINITYKALHSSKITERTISPQTLLRYRDNWYADALCHKREDLRTFSLNRIQNASVLKEEAVLLPIKKLKEHFGDAYGIFSGKAEHVAEIRFTGHAAQALAQEIWHPRQQGETQPDKSYLLRIPYRDSTELIMDVLRWASNAEVISPPKLREEITATLEKTVNKYKKNKPSPAK